MLSGVFCVHIVRSGLERDLPHGLDGYARIKAEQPRVWFHRIADRKILNGIDREEFVDVMLDVVGVGGDFK